MKALEALPVATLIAVIIVIVGGVSVITDDLSYKEYLESTGVMVGLLGIGRGIASRKVH